MVINYKIDYWQNKFLNVPRPDQAHDDFISSLDSLNEDFKKYLKLCETAQSNNDKYEIKTQAENITNHFSKLVEKIEILYERCLVNKNYNNGLNKFNIEMLVKDFSLITAIVEKMLENPDIDIKNKSMQMAIFLIMNNVPLDVNTKKLRKIEKNYKSYLNIFHLEFEKIYNNPNNDSNNISIKMIGEELLKVMGINKSSQPLDSKLIEIITQRIELYKLIKQQIGLPNECNKIFKNFTLSSAIILLVSYLCNVYLVSQDAPLLKAIIPTALILPFLYKMESLNITELPSTMIKQNKFMFGLFLFFSMEFDFFKFSPLAIGLILTELVKNKYYNYLSSSELIKDFMIKAAKELIKTTEKIDFTKSAYKELINDSSDSFGNRILKKQTYCDIRINFSN